MSAGTWKLSAGRRKTNWSGRVFVHFDATNRSTNVHRTVTVILRHDSQGPMLATGRTAREFASRALDEHPELVHQTIDPWEVSP